MNKERYLSPIIEVLTLEEDVVTVSHTYDVGDDTGEDKFE